MITTFLISAREFLEAFLIIGIFLGLSKQLALKKEKEILLASIIGLTVSLFLSVMLFGLKDKITFLINETTAELFEGYVMMFSGVFIAYVVLSLHRFFATRRSGLMINPKDKMERDMFDFSLFLVVTFLIIREGFEIAIFTTATSLFTQFTENIAGLILGFTVSAILGLIMFSVYTNFPIKKVFKATEYLMVLLGAALMKNGLSEIIEIYYNFHLSSVIPIKLAFLPHKSTFLGHFIKNSFGLEQNFSLAKLSIMIGYIILVYFLFLGKQNRITKTAA